MPTATAPHSQRLDPDWPYPIWEHGPGGPISIRLMSGLQLRDTRTSLSRWLASPQGETNEVLAMWWSVIDDEIMARIRISRERLSSRRRRWLRR